MTAGSPAPLLLASNMVAHPGGGEGGEGGGPDKQLKDFPGMSPKGSDKYRAKRARRVQVQDGTTN